MLATTSICVVQILSLHVGHAQPHVHYSCKCHASFSSQWVLVLSVHLLLMRFPEPGFFGLPGINWSQCGLGILEDPFGL